MIRARMALALAMLVGIGWVAACTELVGSSHENDATERARRDQLRMAVQEICPVSGQKLGSHGDPIKAAVGEHKEEVFLCCEGCAKGKIDPKHWATIHANFAKAQQICPVMKHTLPQNPKWTIVQGKIVYVCCLPCTKKIIQHPDVFLKAIDELYAASISANQTRR